MNNKELIEQGRQIGMVQGLCIAIADLLRERYIGPAKEIWQGAGLSIKECKKMKVDEYDLNELIKHEKELS